MKWGTWWIFLFRNPWRTHKSHKKLFVKLRDTRVNSWMNEWTRGWTFSSFKYLHKFYRSLGIEENFKSSDKVYANKSAASFFYFQQTKTGGTFLHLFVRKSIYLSVRLTFRRHHITINRYRRSRIYAKDKQNPLEIYLVFLFNFSSNTYTQFFGILRTSSGIKKNSNPIQILWNCWLLLVVKVNEVLMDVLFIF